MAKIFVVSDEEAVRKIVQIVLEKAGYEAYTFESTSFALTSLGIDAPPDLVICDFEFGGRKDTNGFIPHCVKIGIRVILMTGYTRNHPAVAEIAKIGVNSTLFKPFDAGALREAVSVALATKK